MEIHQLQCFLAVLEEGGFQRATARLGITQPALSYQIKRLEEELGVELFHRRAGGVTPTEAGRALVGHAQQVIAAVKDAHQAVRELATGASGEIRIGTINCVGTYFLPRVLWQVRASHPTVRPKLMYLHVDELLGSLLASGLDAALVPDPPPDPRLANEPLMEERISLVSSAGHPFFGRATVDVSELGGVPFVALSPRTPTGALVRSYLADRLGLPFTPAVAADDVETVKRMVEAGVGVAFLPDIATSEDLGADGHPGRLWRSGVEPALAMQVAIVTRRDAEPSAALDAFLDEVRRTAREAAAKVA